MLRYLTQRLLTIAPVLVLVSLIAYSLILLLPGDPALAILGEQARDEQLYRTLRRELGLDRPVALQYFDWARRAAAGDFGLSIRTRQPIRDALRQRLQPTVQLAVMAFVLAVLIALPVGIVSAVRPNSRLDVIGTVGALSGVAIPHFWLGILLIYVLSVWLRWLPPSGYVALTQDPVQSMRLMLMPAVTLSTGIAAVIARQVRSALIEALQQEYIVTARAKGLGERRVVRVHGLKNALIPVVTVLGLQVGRLIGGAAVVETVFSIPGVGRLAVDSIFFRDFPVVQAVVMVTATAVLVANLATDVLYAYLDPRIRYT